MWSYVQAAGSKGIAWDACSSKGTCWGGSPGAVQYLGSLSMETFKHILSKKNNRAKPNSKLEWNAVAVYRQKMICWSREKRKSEKGGKRRKTWTAKANRGRAECNSVQLLLMEKGRLKRKNLCNACGDVMMIGDAKKASEPRSSTAYLAGCRKGRKHCTCTRCCAWELLQESNWFMTLANAHRHRESLPSVLESGFVILCVFIKSSAAVNVKARWIKKN